MRFGDAAFKFKGRAGPLYGTFAICWIMSGVIIIAGIFLFVFAGWEVNQLWPGLDPKKDTSLVTWLVIVGVLAFVAYMLLIPALWSLYTATQMRKFGEYTRFDGAQFKLEATAGSIIWLSVANLLIYIFTLGFGWPFVQQRTFRYIVDRLKLEGAIDVERIRQSTASIPTRGEGLADAFDVGAW
jgi:uncharacterized membrane protein YjgN (DUF898 family)